MLSRLMVLAFGFVLIGVPIAMADVDSAIAKLDKFKAGDGRATLDAALVELRAEVPAGDLTVWKRLRKIVENVVIPLRVRSEVLQFALEKADNAIALDMLALFSDWSNQLPTTDKYVPNPETDARITLLGFFVKALHSESWNRWLGMEADAYDFLERIILRTTPGMDINHDGIEALVAASGSPKAQRRVVERIVASNRNNTEPSSKLLGLLDTSSYPKLRALVRESNDPDRFHFAAAAALAYVGDVGIRNDLETLFPTFQGKDRNAGGMLTYYMWQIEVQNPPEKLLSFIAEAPPPEVSVEKRMWAVRRAVERGLARPDIRKAVLKHASFVQPDKKTGIRRGLSSLKKLCLELEVLEAGDLPNVTVATAVQAP